MAGAVRVCVDIGNYPYTNSERQSHLSVYYALLYLITLNKAATAECSTRLLSINRRLYWLVWSTARAPGRSAGVVNNDNVAYCTVIS